MAYPILAAQNTWYKGATAKNTVTQIDIVDSYTPTAAVESWAADVDGTGSIMCYITQPESGGITLTIAGNSSGKIAANADSSMLFSGSGSTTCFTAVTSFTGAELLDTSGAVTLSAAFAYCWALSALDVSSWDVSGCTNLSTVFGQCRALAELDVSGWDTSACTSMQSMFYDCRALTALELSSWDVSQITSMRTMFAYCYALTTIGDVGSWRMPKCTTMMAMFTCCSSLTSINALDWDTSGCTNMAQMFDMYNTSTNVASGALTHVDVSKWDVSKVTSMQRMFQGCTELLTIDASGWDTGACADMGFMFYNCNNLLSVGLKEWDVSSVTTFDHTFAHCYNMQDIDTSKWDTSACTSMYCMYNQAKNEVIDISNFDTGNVITFGGMFENCVNLTKIIGIGNLDTSSAIDFNQMFKGCSSLQALDISSFDTRNAKDGVEVSPNNSYSKSTNMMFDGMTSLRELHVGANFYFDGDGTSAYDPAILPETDDGKWYALSTESYNRDAMPNGLTTTYYPSLEDARSADVIVKNSVLIDTAGAIRRRFGYTDKYRPSEFAPAINTIVVYDNGVAYSGGGISSSIITNKAGANGGVDAAYSVNGEWTGIRCYVDASGSAGASGICAFTTAQMIYIPEGYTQLNAILISRDHYSSPSRGCVGLNLWSAAGAYNANNVFSVGTAYATDTPTEGAAITLTDSAPEIKTVYSATLDNSGALPEYQLIRASSGAIPAGNYYAGGYVRRTATYTGGSNGNSMVIRKIWLT